MKIFHFKEKIDSLHESVNKILPPIHIRLKPTNICNHNCQYCAYRANNLQVGKDMIVKDYIPKNKMIEIIEDLEEMNVKAVTFTGGGEPFCYPHLLEIVKKILKTNIKFAAMTNGSLLSNELSEIFAHNATWLRVSIDGWDDASYSYYRGVKIGEFKKIMNNMKKFKNLNGSCYLGVSFIIDKKNSLETYNLINQLKDIGVDSVKVSPCIVSNDGLKNNQFHKPIYNKVKELTKKAIEDFTDENFEIYDAYHELDEKFNKTYDWCPYQQILPVIGADQCVYSCQDKAYNKDIGLIGSIKSMRFKDMWYSDKENFFKINPSIHCDHHCVANIKNLIIHEYLNANKEHLMFV